MVHLIIDDMICPECSRGDCNNHQNNKIATDEKTGLEIKVLCNCRHEKGVVFESD